MKLIIDIPEEDYKFIKDLQNLIIGSRGNCKTIQKNVIDAIKNGIPLALEQSNNCPNEKRGTFVARPIEVVKIGEPLSNSDVIRQATEKGELYRRGFKDAMKRYKRPQGEWSDESKDSLLCSACGKRVYKPFIGGFPTERTSHYYPNFCAFCGADMRKGGEK